MKRLFRSDSDALKLALKALVGRYSKRAIIAALRDVPSEGNRAGRPALNNKKVVYNLVEIVRRRTVGRLSIDQAVRIVAKTFGANPGTIRKMYFEEKKSGSHFLPMVIIERGDQQGEADRILAIESGRLLTD